MKEIVLASTQDEILDFRTLTEFERLTIRFALFCEIANEKVRLIGQYSDEELMALQEVYNFIGGDRP